MAGPRTPFVAGNWKMFKGPSEAASFAAALAGRVEALAGVQVALCPPYVSLAATLAALDGSPVEVYAQNVHWAESGPFTGEISPPMLREVGVAGAVIGHSERRQHFGESDESVARRVGAALGAGLAVIACVGELESEREAGQTVHVLRRQVTAVAGALDGRDVSRLAIAYEPVWAIGTGKTATPAQAQEAHALIRGILDVRILYGGSVKPENAAELLAEPDVDGALVGGASLDVDTFVAICEAADRSRS